MEALTIGNDVVLHLYENEYIDYKREYVLVTELSVVSHSRIMRFDVKFIFERPNSLLLWMLELSIIYKKILSGGSLVQY